MVAPPDLAVRPNRRYQELSYDSMEEFRPRLPQREASVVTIRWIASLISG
jgi:hypothetical protein